MQKRHVHKKDDAEFEKRHFFKVQEKYLENWTTEIPQKDKSLNTSHYICNLDFDKRFIVSDFVHTINGEEVRFARGKWALTDDT